MNPWAFIVIALGILLIIMGVKGTQHNIASALVGHQTNSGSNTTASSSGASSGTSLA